MNLKTLGHSNEYKIPDFEQRALTYWQVSSIWRGKSAATMTISKAFTKINGAVTDLPMNRGLSKRLIALRTEIVMEPEKQAATA